MSQSWEDNGAAFEANSAKLLFKGTPSRSEFPSQDAHKTESKTLCVTFSVVVKTTGTVYYQSDPKLDGVTL
ncbi:hypothetical protein YC2023_063359 [Brassica napus]